MSQIHLDDTASFYWNYHLCSSCVIFVDSTVNIIGTYYFGVLLSKQLLFCQSCQVPHKFTFQQHNVQHTGTIEWWHTWGVERSLTITTTCILYVCCQMLFVDLEKQFIEIRKLPAANRKKMFHWTVFVQFCIVVKYYFDILTSAVGSVNCSGLFSGFRMAELVKIDTSFEHMPEIVHFLFCLNHNSRPAETIIKM